MAENSMKVEEARLLAVFRAIKELDKPEHLGVEDVGWVLKALETAVDLDKKEQELSGASLKQLILGFVAGVAMATPPDHVPVPQHYEELPIQSHPYFNYDEEESGHFVGGPSGGVALEQGNNPDYVAQTGVRTGQNDE